MTKFTLNPKLAPIYSFFEQTGTARLHGLDPGYFAGLDENEKEEAWSFLSARFALSTETITALYQLDEKRAVAMFKKEIEAPIPTAPYPAEQQALEECRLLMLRYICKSEPDKKYVLAMTDFARSEFSSTRAQFARSIPADMATKGTVDALKGMIFTETERLPLASAIAKFMQIHGVDVDKNDPAYDAIYRSLRCDDPEEKLSAMKRLNERL